MTDYKKEHLVKIRRKVIAWEETVYEISCLSEEEAIKIAINENVFSTNKLQNGIITSSSQIDKNSIRRLNQEESWILSTGSGISEIPKAELVVEVISTTVGKLGKKVNMKGYWKDNKLTKDKL